MSKYHLSGAGNRMGFPRPFFLILHTGFPMFHLAAYTALVGTAAVDADLSLANDQMIPSNSGGQAILPWDAQVYAAWAIGATITRAKIVAPSLRQITYPYITPFDVGTAVPDLPALDLFNDGYRPKVMKNEALNIQTTNTAGAPERHQGFLWLCPRYDPAPPGVLTTVRLTSTVTGSANQWDSGVMTPTETLPFGRYAVVGMRVVGANIMAGRLIPTDGGIRPGVLASVSASNDDRSYWRGGAFGKFLEFEQTSLPQVELYKTAAGTTQEVFLDIIKLA